MPCPLPCRSITKKKTKLFRIINVTILAASGYCNYTIAIWLYILVLSSLDFSFKTLTLNGFYQMRLIFRFSNFRIFSLVLSIYLMIYDAVPFFAAKFINYSVLNRLFRRKISFKIKHYEFGEICPLHTSISSYVFFSSNWFSLAVSWSAAVILQQNHWHSVELFWCYQWQFNSPHFHLNLLNFWIWNFFAIWQWGNRKFNKL